MPSLRAYTLHVSTYVRAYYIYGGKARICLKVVWLLRSEHGAISSSLQILGQFEGLVPEEVLNEHTYVCT